MNCDKSVESCRSCKVHQDLLSVVLKKMPDDRRFYDLAELYKVFGDTTRIKILFVLLDQEVCVCDIADALNMTSSAISHQLNILKRSKLIKSRREGKSVYYSLADIHVKTIISQGMIHLDD